MYTNPFKSWITKRSNKQEPLIQAVVAVYAPFVKHNLLVHLGINKKMKIFGGGGIIRQLLRLTTVSLQCDYYLVAYSSSILASPRCYDYLASSHSVDIIITGATSSSNSLWINMQSKKSIQKKGLAYKMLIHCESCVSCTLQDDAAQNV